MDVQIRRLIYDIASQQMAVEMTDGNLLEDQMSPSIAEKMNHFQRMETDLASNDLRLTFDGGESVRLDLGWPGAEDLPPVGRKIVYLDQCHWVSLAQYRYAPERLSPEVAEACAELIRLAENHSILLALSSANFAETADHGPHRRHLALTMMQLSRGWQMRTPMNIRGQEIRARLEGNGTRAEEVFTLEPGAIFGRSQKVDSPRDFPADWQELHRRTTTASATAAMLLENREPDERAAGRAAAAAWAAPHTEISRQWSESKISADELHREVHIWLLNDLRTEIATAGAEAGVGPNAVVTWLKQDAYADFSEMPFLARLREVLFHRLKNPEDRWEPNDLVDVHFLSCAAAYADVVVGERKASHFLQLASSGRDDGAQITSSLPDAVASLN